MDKQRVFYVGSAKVMETADGLAPVAYSASAVPQDRFHVMPREMPIEMIDEIIHGYAQAARRMEAAGIDGVEIVASHGYLPTQFLNPNTNKRQDEYGGSAENRLRFLERIIDQIRTVTADDFVVGIRISSREMDDQELGIDETIEACKKLSSGLDFIDVIGTLFAIFQ